MKKILSSMLATIMMLGVSAFAEGTDFSDVKKSHWAYSDIQQGTENGLFSGYPDGSFRPGANLTRAEAIKILTVFTGRVAAKPSESKFKDVDVNAWYAPYVNAAESFLPEKWADEKLFRPGVPITREEAIYAIVTAMHYNYKEDRADLSYIKSFSDKEKIGFGLEDCIAIAVELGIISGYDDNTIRPNANITRAELATLMSRLAKLKAVTDERREKVVEYMKEEMLVLWKSDKDFSYSLTSEEVPPEQLDESYKSKIYKIVKGRVYQGVPYSYAAGDLNSFLDFSTGQDANGVYTVSGLSWEDLSTAGGSSVRTARIGNDCGASIQLAYGSVGHTRSISGVTKLAPDHGYPRVGKYKTPSKTYNVNTPETIAMNTPEVMYQSLSQLQKGDMILYSGVDGANSHTKMVTGVKVIYDESGKIDAKESYVLTCDQTKGRFTKEKKYYDEKLGCDVYQIGSDEYKTTFEKVVKDSYIPATAEILIDPTPVEKPVVTDSLSRPTQFNIFTGTIKSNWMIASARMDIADASGRIVQTATILPVRSAEVAFGYAFKINMSKFENSRPGLIEGKINIDELPKGDYHATLTVRLASNEEFKVRDFDFSTKNKEIKVKDVGSGDKLSEPGMPENYELLKPVYVIANDEPEEINIAPCAIDNDFSTSWTSNKDSKYIELDLGEVKEFDGIALAFKSGASRVYNFEIMYSEDNVNYTRVYNGKSSGKTTEFESLKIPGKARYIRLVGHFNSASKWNNLTEFHAYKLK